MQNASFLLTSHCIGIRDHTACHGANRPFPHYKFGRSSLLVAGVEDGPRDHLDLNDRQRHCDQGEHADPVVRAPDLLRQVHRRANRRSEQRDCAQAALEISGWGGGG